MEETKKELDNKKLIIRIALLVIMLLLLITGTSLAAYTWRYNSTNPNRISTTEISLDFLESTDEIINITNALPVTDEEGKYQNEYFDFSVNTKSTTPRTINYTITIEKLTADAGFTLFNDSDIKVYLEDYDRNVLVEPTLISNLTNYALYTHSNVHTTGVETIQTKFRLRAWIDNSKADEAKNWTESTKLQYKFKLNVSGAENS